MQQELEFVTNIKFSSYGFGRHVRKTYKHIKNDWIQTRLLSSSLLLSQKANRKKKKVMLRKKKKKDYLVLPDLFLDFQKTLVEETGEKPFKGSGSTIFISLILLSFSFPIKEVMSTC